ncbi:deaminase [Paludisphaera borealis]|uniref:Guanine deaminase n=1 Tax=Paludisphaera borealis TaxID=1387353 RepID=A0A1U7CQJ6_9BACT|nr:deaminase [Paludisphaera borealis]APW61179.1 Guanine deaminase [Paludisphaera borealis]
MIRARRPRISPSNGRTQARTSTRPAAQVACIVFGDGEIVAEAVNLLVQTHDPTAHAEFLAIRAAAAALGAENFTGCAFTLLAHCCPMYLAAARIDGLFSVL